MDHHVIGHVDEVVAGTRTVPRDVVAHADRAMKEALLDLARELDHGTSDRAAQIYALLGSYALDVMQLQDIAGRRMEPR